MAFTPDLKQSILIIGGGTFGCSTALHLARRGHENVTVLDAYAVPSPISAGNDINKIMEEGPGFPTPTDSISTKLKTLATTAWLTDPVFAPHYHPTGLIVSAHTPDGIKQLKDDERVHPISPDYEWLDSPEAFRATMPEGVLTGDFPNWRGGLKREKAGWVEARGALVDCAKEAGRLGVKFVTGEEGDVKKLLYDGGDVVGVEVASGSQHFAKTTILAAGAAAPQLLDMKDQLRPTAWTLAHIKLSEEECKLYKDLPVLFNLESGFFMEPDLEKHELKICDEHPGYTNFTSPGVSTPFAKHQIPIQAENRVREFLQHTMPHLAERPFVFARICWCADTPDRNFLIGRHSEIGGLVLAVGGSGHGFMHITSVGGLVVDCLEGKLDAELAESMRWRPETAVGRDWGDLQGRRGAGNRVMDFGEVEGEGGWTSVEEGQREIPDTECCDS